MSPERTVLYIDNSNIFRGCKKSGWRPSYKRVKEHVEREEGDLCAVHFFASEQSVPRDKQSRFYSALRNDLGFQLHTFQLAHRKVICPKCGHEEWIPTEKGVDVGLATQLLKDFKEDAFGQALVMSSDRDFYDAMQVIREGGRKVKILAWRWTLPPELVRSCRDQDIPVCFLEEFQPQFQKPEGEVL